MLILFGYPSCGKTTLGQLLANKVGVPFIDTDQEVEKRWGMSCRALVQQKGEIFFRDCEQEVIHSLDSMDAVIAVGGGSLLRLENRERLKKLGLAVYLEIGREGLKKRLHIRGLPATTESLDVLYDFRKPIYETYADKIVDVRVEDNSVIIKELINIWSTRWELKRNFVRE